MDNVCHGWWEIFITLALRNISPRENYIYTIREVEKVARERSGNRFRKAPAEMFDVSLFEEREYGAWLISWLKLSEIPMKHHVYSNTVSYSSDNCSDVVKQAINKRSTTLQFPIFPSTQYRFDGKDHNQLTRLPDGFGQNLTPEKGLHVPPSPDRLSKLIQLGGSGGMRSIPRDVCYKCVVWFIDHIAIKLCRQDGTGLYRWTSHNDRRGTGMIDNIYNNSRRFVLESDVLQRSGYADLVPRFGRQSACNELFLHDFYKKYTTRKDRYFIAYAYYHLYECEKYSSDKDYRQLVYQLFPDVSSALPSDKFLFSDDRYENLNTAGEIIGDIQDMVINARMRNKRDDDISYIPLCKDEDFVLIEGENPYLTTRQHECRMRKNVFHNLQQKLEVCGGGDGEDSIDNTPLLFDPDVIMYKNNECVNKATYLRMPNQENPWTREPHMKPEVGDSGISPIEFINYAVWNDDDSDDDDSDDEGDEFEWALAGHL